MGGCMSFYRFVRRNQLEGEPGSNPTLASLMLTGDLARLKQDQRDMRHLERYARAAGVSPEQVRVILDLFLDHDCEGQTPHGLFKFTGE